MVSRYNPCGRVVDIGHDAYTTRARLYPDSDQEFDIRWYEALPDAPVLGFPSALNNLVFERDRYDWIPTAVGEIFGAPYQQQPPGRNPLARGDHFCGTREDFAGDGQIDTTSPPVVYRPDGLPLCCGQQFESQGGLALGGTATVDTPIIVLAQVVSSSGTPPVHICVRMTRDASNDVIEYSPLTEYTQVLNPESFAYPTGALIQIYEIDDWPGWFWGELYTTYEATETVSLNKDTSTGTVTASAITQLSLDADTSGLKLKGDGNPTFLQYYGTPQSNTNRGYYSFESAVGPVLLNPAIINQLLTSLFGGTNEFGIAIIALGGGVFVAGVDQTVDATVDESLVNTTGISVTDAALLQVKRTNTVYTNSFNAAGLIVDRQPGVPFDNTTQVTFEGSETIEVVGDAATGTLTFAAIYQMSITADADGLKLVGDLEDPGASYAYSTNGAGDKGWYPLDGTWLDMVAGVFSHIGPASTGHTTVVWPSIIVYDSKGHVVSATVGTTPVTSISTTGGTGGPLTGAITLAGTSGITLSVASNTITFTLTGGGVGPAPTTAPVLTATAGVAQVSLSWTTATGATSYVLFRGGSQIYAGTGLAFVDTGLTNGVTYNYVVNGVNNSALGPPGSASATPMGFYLLDHFTDANGTALTAHLMDYGPGGIPNELGWQNLTGTGWLIESDRAQCPNSGSFIAADSQQTSYHLSCIVNPGTDNVHGIGLVVRATAGDPNNLWLLDIATGSNNCQLFKVVAGVFTAAAQATVTWAQNTNNLVTVTVTTTSITAVVAGATLSVLDATFATHTLVGLKGVSTQHTFDDFQVTS